MYLCLYQNRKAETGLQKVAEVGRNGSNEIQPKLDTNRMQLSFGVYDTYALLIIYSD